MRPPHVEFMNTGRGSWSRAKTAVKDADGGMFWWTIAITVLLGLATFSWIFCIYVFSHPEKPFNYRFLARVHKLEDIRQFTEKNVPPGKTFDPRGIYQKYYSWADDQLATNNDLLRRNYITNFGEDRPIYVKGRFKIIHARSLGPDDVFPNGVVARAVALTDNDREFRNVMIEYVLPTENAQTKVPFAAGDVLEIDTRRTVKRLYSAVLNVEKLPADSLLFTVVPLLYGKHAVDEGKGQILIAAPPERLNLTASLPITAEYAHLASNGSAPEVPPADVAATLNP